MKQIILLISLWILPMVSADTGAAHVRGQLLCDGKPFASEKIEIWEKDYVLADTLVATEMTDKHGFFSIKGAATDKLFSPHVYIYIPNYCGVASTEIIQCGYTLKISLPDAFVSPGNLPKTTFNLDKLELNKAKTEEHGLGKYWYWFRGGHKECRSTPQTGSEVIV